MGKSVRLKSILRNFLNHFETLESRHKLSVESNDDSIDLYRQEFQTLKELTETLKTDPNCASDEGENDVNRRKNRYKDILPYDHSRVILSEYPGVPGSDYMNANYVRGSSGCSRAYIASQGPLPNTVVDFWRMIWETDVTVIVMACNERESGKYKCESYWPQDNDEPQQYGNITVELVKWRQVCPDFLVRTLKVRSDSTERTVCQFHYQTWPDHGVPNSVHPILELVRLMRDVQISETRPILVHCSAGCGRTGTICSIDYVWALLRTGKLREDFSLYLIIKEMRKQRIAMVQTLEQYMLCYKAVATLFEQQLKMIDSHTYENIDGDGEPLMRRQLLRSDINRKEENEENLNQKMRTNDHKIISETNVSAVQNSPSNASDEVRHERIVGKATVIRRPSIAKLKAIFENQNQNLISTETPIVRSSSSSFNRFQGFKDNPRNCKSMIENNIPIDNSRHEMVSNCEQLIQTNISDQNIRSQQEMIERHNMNTNGGQQPIYVEFNKMNNSNENRYSIENSQSFDSNSIELFQNNHLNRSQMESYGIESDQKLLHQNHQKLQQEIRQHIQRKNLQSFQAIHSQMSSNFAISQQIGNQTLVVHQIGHQMSGQLPMPMIGQIQSQPLPPPPKPPRTYQYHMNDGSINTVPNASEGRLIVSVALPRRPTNELNINSNNHYEPIGRRPSNLSVPNLDSILVNNNIENYNNPNINPNNTIKVMNVSNNNIYESVLPKYRGPQPMESTLANGQHNQNIHSYYDLMKLKNPNLNTTLPFYDTLYARNGYMTVPNLRHISVPTHIAQIQCPYAQFKPNFEAIYSNTNSNVNTNNNITNNLSKTKSEQNIRKSNEKITNNLVNNLVNKSENIKNCKQINKKLKNIDKKEGNPSNSVKTNSKQESSKTTANTSSNSQTSTQESNSGTFSKISNAFKVLKMKPSIKTKNKSNANTNSNNSSSANTVNNAPIVSRPPHSHRFSPPTQWTQV